MKKEDIKELTVEELQKKVEESKLMYKKLKFNHKVSQVEDPMRLKFVKKDIARLLTELKQRELSKLLAGDKNSKISEEKEVTKKIK